MNWNCFIETGVIITGGIDSESTAGTSIIKWGSQKIKYCDGTKDFTEVTGECIWNDGNEKVWVLHDESSFSKRMAEDY